MAVVDDAILADISVLLGDCQRQFSRQKEDEAAKMEGTLSLVELETTAQNVQKFGTLSDACARYAAIICPTMGNS